MSCGENRFFSFSWVLVFWAAESGGGAAVATARKLKKSSPSFSALSPSHDLFSLFTCTKKHKSYSAGGSAAAAHPFFAGGRSGSGGRATPVPSTSGGGAFAASSPSRGGGWGGGDTAATTTTTTTTTAAATTKEATPGGGDASNQGGGNNNSNDGEGNEGEGTDDGGDDDDVKFIACTPATTLLSLIGIFLANSVHRVYVVDDLAAPRPTAVVTPTDVFRVLAGVF